MYVEIIRRNRGILLSIGMHVILLAALASLGWWFGGAKEAHDVPVILKAVRPDLQKSTFHTFEMIIDVNLDEHPPSEVVRVGPELVDVSLDCLHCTKCTCQPCRNCGCKRLADEGFVPAEQTQQNYGWKRRVP